MAERGALGWWEGWAGREERKGPGGERGEGGEGGQRGGRFLSLLTMAHKIPTIIIQDELRKIC